MRELSVEHFGEWVREGKYGHRLTRDLYAQPNRRPSVVLPREIYTQEQWDSLAWMYSDDEHRSYSDKAVERFREDALENFDLNMAFFATIPPAQFEDALTDALGRGKTLRPVTRLRDLEGKSGLYILVLDDYRQAYIGQAGNLRHRIKSHWWGTKQFDRLVFGHPHESVLSIDAFRVLDTTRVYAATTARPDALEARLVRHFPQSLLLNRVAGGKPDDIRLAFMGLEGRRRQLI